MSSGSSSSNSNNNNNKKHKTIINNLKRNTKTKNDPKKDSKEAARKKTYRSHHTDYRPFVRYIEHHSGIDDETVEKAKRRFGILGSNSKSNSNNNSNTFATSSSTLAKQESGTMNQGDAFGDQRSSALAKKERDDARHADLHANYKAKNFTDADKIFLLKREIDSLKEKAASGPGGGGTGGSAKASYSSSLAAAAPSAHHSFFAAMPLFTLLLVAGVLLVAARWTRNKLRLVRAEASLLASAGQRRATGDAREHESGHATVELRESTLFSSMAESWAAEHHPGGGSGGGGGLFSYRAPEPETGEATLRFV